MDFVTMNERELNRLKVIQDVIAGRLPARAASQTLGVTRRQVQRLRRCEVTDTADLKPGKGAQGAGSVARDHVVADMPLADVALRPLSWIAGNVEVARRCAHRWNQQLVAEPLEAEGVDVVAKDLANGFDVGARVHIANELINLS